MRMLCNFTNVYVTVTLFGYLTGIVTIIHFNIYLYIVIKTFNLLSISFLLVVVSCRVVVSGMEDKDLQRSFIERYSWHNKLEFVLKSLLQWRPHLKLNHVITFWSFYVSWRKWLYDYFHYCSKDLNQALIYSRSSIEHKITTKMFLQWKPQERQSDQKIELE